METGRIGKSIESFVTREEMREHIQQVNSPKSELPFEEPPVSSLLSSTPMLTSNDFKLKPTNRDLLDIENDLRKEMHNLFNEKHDEEMIKLVVAGELGKIDDVLADIVSSIEKLSKTQTTLEERLHIDPVANQLVIESISNAQAEILQENFDEIRTEFDSLRSEAKRQQTPDIVPQMIEMIQQEQVDEIDISDSKLKSLTKRIKKLEKNKFGEIYSALEELAKQIRDDINSRFALSARSQQQMAIEVKNAHNDIGQLTTRMADSKRFLTDRIGDVEQQLGTEIDKLKITINLQKEMKKIESEDSVSYSLDHLLKDKKLGADSFSLRNLIFQVEKKLRGDIQQRTGSCKLFEN